MTAPSLTDPNNNNNQRTELNRWVVELVVEPVVGLVGIEGVAG